MTEKELLEFWDLVNSPAFKKKYPTWNKTPGRFIAHIKNLDNVEKQHFLKGNCNH